MFEVTYAMSFYGTCWKSAFFRDRKRAEELCGKINAQARRGLRPFSEVFEVSPNAKYSTHTV